MDEFQPEAQLSSDAIRYIHKNALKLFQHARDVERAWNELEASGLRKKLIQFTLQNKLMEIILSHPKFKSFHKLFIMFEFGMEKMFLERQKNPEILKLFNGISEGNFGHGMWFDNLAAFAESLFKLKGAGDEAREKVADYLFSSLIGLRDYHDAGEATYYLEPAIALYFDTADVIPERFTKLIALIDDSPRKTEWLKKLSRIKDRRLKCPELLKFRTWFPTN